MLTEDLLAILESPERPLGLLESISGGEVLAANAAAGDPHAPPKGKRDENARIADSDAPEAKRSAEGVEEDSLVRRQKKTLIHLGGAFVVGGAFALADNERPGRRRTPRPTTWGVRGKPRR